MERKSLKANTTNFISTLVALAIPIIWYYKTIPEMKGNPVILGIFGNQKLSVQRAFEIIEGTLISTLPELLINYGSVLFFLSGLYFIFKNRWSKNKLLKIFFIVGIALVGYFIFELDAIGIVHDYYLFPFLPLIFILVSYGCFSLLNSQKVWLTRFSFFLLLILPVTAYLRANSRWHIKNPGFNSDLLVYKTELQNAVPNNALCVVGNDESRNIFFYYINKKGWAFEKNELDSSKLNALIGKGAQYLYSDSREVDEQQEIKKYIHSLVLQQGSIKVYKLKQSYK